MPLAIDASTPAAATNSNGTTATVTTGSFTPPTGSLLLNLWSGNTSSGTNPFTPTITDNLGAHLTYNLQDWQSRADSPTVDGQAADWTALVGTSAAQTVTVTSGTGVGNQQSALQVVVITGQHATPVGAHGKSGSASTSAVAQNFTGTAAGSMGFIVVTDWDALGSMTAGTGCTLIATGTIPTTQISWGMFRRTTADGTVGGTTTMNVNLAGTSTHVTWTYVEIVPAASTAVTTTLPPPLPQYLLFELLARQQYLAGASASPSQTITPTGITSSEALGSPTVTPGSVTVTASGIVSSERLGAATVTSTVTVTASGVPSSEQLGSPTVTSTYTINASGIPSGETLGTPTLATTVTVQASGIPSSEAVGSASAVTAVAVNASGIPSSERLGSPTVTTTYTIQASGIPSSEALGKATTTSTVNVNASGIPSAEALGTPGIQVIAVVSASGIPSQEQLGSPTVTTTYTINASGISSSERLGSPTIAVTTLIQASGIPSSEAFGKATVTPGSVTVQASGIPSSEALGRAQVSLGILALQIQASGIPSSEAFGAPYVGVVVQIDITATVKVDVIVWRADPDLEAPVVIPGIVSRADDDLEVITGPDAI